MALAKAGESSNKPPIWNDDMQSMTQDDFVAKKTVLFPITYFDRLVKCSEEHVKTRISNAIAVNNFSGCDIKFNIWQIVDEAGSLNLEDLNSFVFNRKPLISTTLAWEDACFAFPAETELEIAVGLVRQPSEGHYGTSSSNSVTAEEGTGEFHLTQVRPSSAPKLKKITGGQLPANTIRISRDSDLGRTYRVSITSGDKEIPLKDSLISQGMEDFEVRVLRKYVFALVDYDEQQQEVITSDLFIFDLSQMVVVISDRSGYDTFPKPLVVNKGSFNIRQK